MRSALIILLFVLGAESASAQFYDKMFFAGWNFNEPLVNRDVIGASSSKGARFGYREVVTEKFAVGVDVTWTTFNDFEPRQTYYTPTSAITTDYNYYVNNYGVLLTGDYYFRVEKKVMPYAGLGAGLGYSNYRAYYNVYSAGENAFGLMLRPQAGVWLKFNERRNWAFNAGVHFDYSTAKSKELNYNNFMNVGLELGVVFLDW